MLAAVMMGRGRVWLVVGYNVECGELCQEECLKRGWRPEVRHRRAVVASFSRSLSFGKAWLAPFTFRRSWFELYSPCLIRLDSLRFSDSSVQSRLWEREIIEHK